MYVGNKIQSNLCLEMQQHRMPYVYQECLELHFARHLVQIYLKKTHRTPWPVTFLVIPVNFPISRTHYTPYRNGLNVFKSLGVYRMRCGLLSIVRTTGRNIFVAHQQQLLEYYFHYICLVQEWKKISSNCFHVSKLSCNTCIHHSSNGSSG